MSELTDLGARLSAVGHLPDPVLRARELIHLQAVAASAIAAATDAAVAEAVERLPHAEVADRLGVSEHQIRRRLTAHRARIGRPGRPGRRPRST